jgi:hypothetical protein
MTKFELLFGQESADAALRAYSALYKFLESRANGGRFRPPTTRFVEFVAADGRFGGPSRAGDHFIKATATPSKFFIGDFNEAIASYPGPFTVVYEHGWPIIQQPLPEVVA